MNKIRGFSIVELIVVLSIFAVISSISMFNYNAYQARIARVNTAQDIALTIRQAQVYGLAASGGDLGGTDFDDTDTAGTFFGTTTADIITDRSIRGVNINPSTKTFILFEDINRNRVYNEVGDRVIDERTIISEDIILQGCVFSGTPDCAPEVNDGDDMNITFQRPYPDTFVELNNVSYNGAFIHLLDESGVAIVSVQVSPAGQIFVQNI